ncbi:MAG: hypothetical protein ACTSUE_10100 [Promethearchaeota archaeon]
MKITLGKFLDENFGNFILYETSLDTNGDGNKELLAYTQRSAKIENGIRQGINDDNSIFLEDIVANKAIWNYTMDKPNFVVGHVDYISLNGSADLVDPALFVQYAQVEDDEWFDLESNHYIKNETGTYESLLLNMSSTVGTGVVPIIANLSTDIMEERVTGVIPMSYDPLDLIPDFLVVTSNTTKEDDFSEVLYTMYGFLHDGSLAWRVNRNDAWSVMGLNAHHDDSYLLKSVQINSTHFAFVDRSEYDVVVGYLENGSLERSINHTAEITYDEIVSNPFDVTGDNVPELCVKYSNSTANTSYIAFMDSTNGTLLNSPAQMELNESMLIDYKNVRKFSASPDPIFSTIVQQGPNNITKIYAIRASGFELITVFTPAFTYSYACLNSNHVYEYNGAIIISFSYTTLSNDVLYMFFNTATGDHIPISDEINTVILNYYVAGDFLLQYDGMEVTTTLGGNGAVDVLTIGSTSFLWQENLVAMIFLFVAVPLGLICGGMLFILGRKKNTFLQEMRGIQEENPVDGKFGTKSIRNIGGTFLVILLASTSGFTYFLIWKDSSVVYLAPDFLAMRNAYFTLGSLFASLPLIITLFTRLAPRSAMLYVNFQEFIFKKLMRKSKDYKVVVLDMDYARKFSPMSAISRSLFPLLVSLTIGLWVFQAMSSEVLTTLTGDFNLEWIAQFEMYAGMSFILSYFLLSLLIPGGWLLDDAGVVYFVEPRTNNSPGDISKISSWLLNLFKGLFGFTAMVNYYSLFKGLDLSFMFGPDEPIFSIILNVVLVIILSLIMSPILYGFSAMMLSNKSLIDTLPYNKHMLFKFLEKKGIDTGPRRLRHFFE